MLTKRLLTAQAARSDCTAESTVQIRRQRVRSTRQARIFSTRRGRVAVDRGTRTIRINPLAAYIRYPVTAGFQEGRKWWWIGVPASSRFPRQQRVHVPGGSGYLKGGNLPQAGISRGLTRCQRIESTRHSRILHTRSTMVENGGG